MDYKILKVHRKFEYLDVEMQIITREYFYMDRDDPSTGKAVISSINGKVLGGAIETHRDTLKKIKARAISMLNKYVNDYGAERVKEMLTKK